MKLKILSFGGNTFKNNDVESFTVMTKAGEITVLDKHEALITALVSGVIKIIYIEETVKQEKHFAIGKGVVEIANSEVKIFTDMLLNADQVQENELDKAFEEAKKLKEKYTKATTKEDMEKFLQASEQLSKVQAKVKLVELSK